jgi:hypothetical protein
MSKIRIRAYSSRPHTSRCPAPPPPLCHRQPSPRWPATTRRLAPPPTIARLPRPTVAHHPADSSCRPASTHEHHPGPPPLIARPRAADTSCQPTSTHRATASDRRSTTLGRLRPARCLPGPPPPLKVLPSALPTLARPDLIGRLDAVKMLLFCFLILYEI